MLSSLMKPPTTLPAGISRYYRVRRNMEENFIASPCPHHHSSNHNRLLIMGSQFLEQEGPSGQIQSNAHTSDKKAEAQRLRVAFAKPVNHRGRAHLLFRLSVHCLFLPVLCLALNSFQYNCISLKGSCDKNGLSSYVMSPGPRSDLQVNYVIAILLRKGKSQNSLLCLPLFYFPMATCCFCCCCCC